MEFITEGQLAGISSSNLALRSPIYSYTFVILARWLSGDTLAFPGLPCFPDLLSSQTVAAAPARC